MNQFVRSNSRSAENTLRMVANLPAPHGLEDRIKAALAAAPHHGRLLAWPQAGAGRGWQRSGALRAAAAAAIVLAVAGGGWSISARMQASGSARVAPVSVRPSGQTGFSSAGAMRTPQTLAAPQIAPEPKVPAASRAAGQATPVSKPQAAVPDSSR